MGGEWIRDGDGGGGGGVWVYYSHGVVQHFVLGFLRVLNLIFVPRI